jgi:hypothetical protein
VKFLFFLTGIKTPCAGEIFARAVLSRIEDTRVLVVGQQDWCLCLCLCSEMTISVLLLVSLFYYCIILSLFLLPLIFYFNSI